MAKIRIKYRIKSNNNNIKEETIGILNNNELKYKEKDIIVIFNYDKFTLKRESNEFIMEYDFKNEKGYYYIKELNSKLNISFKVKKIDVISNNIDIIYKVDKDEIKYKVEVLE